MTLEQKAERCEIQSVREIAEWQFPNLDGGKGEEKKEEGRIVAALPPIQRGQVWKAGQVEEFWDSLVRGFPVGSFLVTPIRGSNAKREDATEYPYGGSNPNSNFWLLDGQQRADAIALGFYDPWTEKPAAAVLWIDLAEPEKTDAREYAFRLLSRSHPWGYGAKDSGRLSVGERREAVKAYNAAVGGEPKTAYDFSLKEVWPWEAGAPIPMCFLVEAVENCKDAPDVAAVREAVRKRLAKLPFWDRAWTKDDSTQGSLKKAVEQRLDSEFFKGLIGRVAATVCAEPESYSIPVLVLPEKDAAGEDMSAAGDEKQAALETLFVRVNRNGSVISTAELIYSMLKSIWPQAPQAVEALKCGLLPPAQLVVLAARIVLAEEDKGDKKKSQPPAGLGVGGFRRLMHGGGEGAEKSFPADLHNFIEKKEGRGWEIFDKAQKLLLLPDGADYALPRVLGSDLAQHASEVFLLFAVWIDRMLDADADPAAIPADGDARRRMLGLLTAVAWFAQNRDKCVRILWKELAECTPKELPDFFSRKSFAGLLKPWKDKGPYMLPLFSPTVLKGAIEECITQQEGFDKPADKFWKDWKWYNDFANGTTPRCVVQWFGKAFPQWQAKDAEAAKDTWFHFIDKLHENTRILFYAQRKWVQQWSESRPEDLEDLERPWDFDHISPHDYTYSRWGIPDIIRYWNDSTGNLRAWPFEANRSDGDAPARQKLLLDQDAGGISEIEKRYGLQRPSHILEASIILDGEERDWKDCSPRDPDEKYLSQKYVEKYGGYREPLIRAITARFVELYRIWYDGLRIGSLMPEVPAAGE